MSLQQAVQAIKSGDKQTGKNLLIEVVKADPHNENAWLWMTRVVNTDDERIKCLQRVLEINPDNDIARRGLAQLQQKLPVQPRESEARPEPIEEPPELEIEPQPIEVSSKPEDQPKPLPEQPSSPNPPLKKPSTVRPLKSLKREDTKKCPFCAETIKAEAKVCRFCGRDFATGQSPHQAQPQVIVQASPQRLWSPGVAALLSLIIPGAGQIYKGRVISGIFLLIITMTLLGIVM